MKFRLRLYLLSLIILIGCFMLVARLWNIQIDQRDYFSKRTPRAKTLDVRVPGIRGKIRDRNGIVLVDNSVSYEVVFNLREIEKAYKRQHSTTPKRTYTTQVQGRIIEKKETDIVEIVNAITIPQLYNLGLARNYNAKELIRHYRATEGHLPYTYRRDLTFEEFARFAEHNIGLPGVSVMVKPKRNYKYGALLSHVLGYVRPPDVLQLSKEERKKYRFNIDDVADDYGVAGIEKTMDDYLRGQPGKIVLEKNEKGIIGGEVGYLPPQVGGDVYLTIDARIQSITENALRLIGRGAAVVIDPNDGAILAMASVPSYDPNQFIPKISRDRLQEYNQNKAHPFINRSIRAYPPGSLFKIPAACAGCLQGIQHDHYECQGGVQYGEKFMKCWIHNKGGTHGTLDLSEAIKRSCNAFFYLYGNDAGSTHLANACKFLGFGRKTGIKLDGEQAGIVPGSKRWKYELRRGTRMTPALTAQMAIGQGDALATPLQLASMVATIANGGSSYHPHLLQRVVEHEGQVSFLQRKKLRYDLTQGGIAREDIETIRKGMWRVVNEEGGTARRAYIPSLGVSGKTGTAQAVVDGKLGTHSWFIAFAPYEKPKYALCVFVEGGKSGGKVAAPIAAAIIKECIHLEDHSLDYLVESTGNLDIVEEISFGKIVSIKTTDTIAAQESEPSDFLSVSSSQEENVLRVVPAIQPEADEEGTVIKKGIPIYKGRKWKLNRH